MNQNEYSEKMINTTTNDIQAILDRLDTTVIPVPKDMKLNTQLTKTDKIGKDLWAKKANFEHLSIFEKLCDKDDYKTTGKCHISKKTDNLKHCSFCGKQTTKSLLTRKRKDPRNASKFHTICEKCNTAYIERIILEPYWKTQGKLKEMVERKEQNYKKLTEKLTKIEMEIKHCDRQIQVKHNTSEEQCAMLESNKQQLNRELDKLTVIVSDLGKTERSLNNKISQNEEESKKLWARHKNNRKKQEEWNDKMIKIQNEINVLTKEVDERNLTLYEIRQESLRNTNKETIFTNDYKPSVLEREEGNIVTPAHGGRGKGKSRSRETKDLQMKKKPYGCMMI